MGWFRLFTTLAAFAMGAFAAHWKLADEPADFLAFWIAAQHTASPYDLTWMREYQGTDRIGLPFVYPPTLLLFIYPFGLLPLDIAYSLWSGLGLAALVLAATYIARLGAPFLLLSAPPMIATAFGQTSLLIGAAMVSGMTLLDRRPRLAGAVLALAACVKPQAMLAAPIVLWGRWTAVRSAAVTGAGLILLSLIFGPARWIEWYEAASTFDRWFPHVKLVNPLSVLDHPLWKLGVVALGLALASRRNLAGLAAGSICLSPYVQLYDLAALTVVGAAWMGRWKDVGLLPAVIGACIVLPMWQTPLTVTLLLAAVALVLFAPLPFTKPAVKTLA
jgi:Glycosyltransferase family 87